MPTTVNANSRGLVILSFDGGGVRGLSSLLILRECMTQLQSHLQLPKRPEVYEQFDMIGGTGTGGISAAMLGRLRIPLDTAIEHFTALATEVFSDKKYFSVSGNSTFKSTKMQQALKSIIHKTTGDENEKMMGAQPEPDHCKTVVFAMSGHHLNAGLPRAFRSYHAPVNQMPNCTIWEALSATTAHPDLFKSIRIDDGSVRESFVDGGLGCSNPLAHILAEVKLVYPDRRVGCVISIGAGHVRTIQVPRFRPFQRLLPGSTIKVMKAIATDAEQEAQRMAVRFNGTPNVYFRMNVDQGIQSIGLVGWERLNEVTAHARGYMQLREVVRVINQSALAIKKRRGAIAVAHIDGEIPGLPGSMKQHGVKICPQPTSLFVGREDPVRRAASYLLEKNDKQKIFVIHGLGGAGKTQIALRIAQNTHDSWSDIVYADATSVESIETTLRDFAKRKRLGDSFEDTLKWLFCNAAPWLFIIDNAGGPGIEIANYLPQCTHGSILITTRNQDLLDLVLGEDADYKASSMEQGEAFRVLLKAARRENCNLVDSEMDAARRLLEQFGHLPLAIVQAGGYIRSHQCSFVQYQKLYLEQPGQMLQKMTWTGLQPNEYDRATFDTWLLSYMLLRALAQQLLWIMGYMQRDRITLDIFERAALNFDSRSSNIPLSGPEQESYDSVKNFLASFLSPDGKWNGDAFLVTMKEILSCSLIDYDQVNDTYVLHPLVQTWVQAAAPEKMGSTHTAYLIAASLEWKWDSQDHAFMRSVQLHVNAVLQHNPTISADTAACFAHVLQWNGQWNQASYLQTRVLTARTETLGEEHVDTLSAMSSLANTFTANGVHLKRAEELLVKVVETRTRVLSEDHPETLTAMNDLANTCANQGHLKRAEVLLVNVVRARTRLLGGDAPDTLTTMSNLAVIYHNQGASAKAEKLRIHVLGARKRMFGDEHPDTLSAMSDLADTYTDQGPTQNRLGEVVQLRVRILNARRQIFGEEHPDTLIAISNLANTYALQRQFPAAEALEVRVLEARRKILGEEHPDTLTAMNNLALTYNNQHRFDQAEELETTVIASMEKVLGAEHPDTLTAMSNRAVALHDRATKLRNPSFSTQAQHLGLRVVDARRRVLGRKHPDTLHAIEILARIYEDLGQSYGEIYTEMKQEIQQVESRMDSAYETR